MNENPVVSRSKWTVICWPCQSSPFSARDAWTLPLTLAEAAVANSAISTIAAAPTNERGPLFITRGRFLPGQLTLKANRQELLRPGVDPPQP